MPQVVWARAQPHAAIDKSAWIAESMAARRNRYSKAVKVVDPFDVWPWPFDPWKPLHGTHSPEYVEEVRQEQSRGLSAEASSPALAVASAHALRTAVFRVTERHRYGTCRQIVGSLGHGMHHARASEARHGHTFNGLALAAGPALRPGPDGLPSDPVENPAVILDLDGSCGGGTASLIAGISGVRQVDIAVNDLDAYDDTANASLRVVADASDYLDLLRETLDRLEPRVNQSTLCIYSAGIDGFERAERGLRGMTADLLKQRDRMVFEWCVRVDVPTAYTIGGGTVSEAMPREVVVDLHRQTIETAVAVMREHGRS